MSNIMPKKKKNSWANPRLFCDFSLIYAVWRRKREVRPAVRAKKEGKLEKIRGIGLRAVCAPDMIAPSRGVLSFARLFSFFNHHCGESAKTVVRRESHASRTRGGASF